MKFFKAVEDELSLKLTENGAVARSTTLSGLYDLFALGGAYRSRPDEDILDLFENAFIEDPVYAVRCLCYLRDVRGGGQGERRFFRTVLTMLGNTRGYIVKQLIPLIPEYGRYDDLWVLLDTRSRQEVTDYVMKQLGQDLVYKRNGKSVSLLAKWMPSFNASSAETKRLARELSRGLGLSPRVYRKLLSELRAYIKVVETQMSANKWDEIEYDKVPSRAGLIYKNAFRNHDEQRYTEFITSDKTVMKAATLYPYDLAREALKCSNNEIEAAAINKAWDNQIDYFKGQPCSMIAVVDTSGSMTCSYGKGRPQPIDVALSLGIYCAESNRGDFKDAFITFASKPQLIKIKGKNFVEKYRDIRWRSLIDNTNMEATFDLVYNIATRNDVKPEDVPNTLVFISDMEVDCMSEEGSSFDGKTFMDKIRSKWAAAGLKLPNLVFWNVCARNDTILDVGEGVSLVSGCSPVIFEMVMTGKTGYDLMMEKLNSPRYSQIDF